MAGSGRGAVNNGRQAVAEGWQTRGEWQGVTQRWQAGSGIGEAGSGRQAAAWRWQALADRQLQGVAGKDRQWHRGEWPWQEDVRGMAGRQCPLGGAGGGGRMWEGGRRREAGGGGRRWRTITCGQAVAQWQEASRGQEVAGNWQAVGGG